MNNDPEKIFGKLNPKELIKFNVIKDLKLYKELMDSASWNAYDAELKQRNSSVNWEE